MITQHVIEQAARGGRVPHSRLLICFIADSKSTPSQVVQAQALIRSKLADLSFPLSYQVRFCLPGAGEEAIARALREMQSNVEVRHKHISYPHLFVDDWVTIPVGEVQGENEEHWCLNKPIAMTQTLVTQALYCGVMNKPSPLNYGPLFPAIGASWFEAILFCNELSKLLKLEPYYEVEASGVQVSIPNTEGFGVRLPTRQEWCYAACGGRSWPYAGSDISDEVAWSAHNSGSKVHPVARLKHNDFGLYDLSGNAWEWCQEGARDQSDMPLCVGDHHPKWLLGGSWANHPWVFPIGETLAELPGYHDAFMGIRLVKNISEELTNLSDVSWRVSDRSDEGED